VKYKRSFLKSLASSLYSDDNTKAKVRREQEIVEVDFLKHSIFQKNFAPLRLCGEKSSKTISL